MWLLSVPQPSTMDFCHRSGVCQTMLEITVNILQTLLNPKLLVNPLVTRAKLGYSLTDALDLSVQVWRTLAPMSIWGHWAPWWFCRSSSLPPPVSVFHPNCHLSVDEESCVICSRGKKGWYWELTVALRSAGAKPAVVTKPLVGITLVCSFGWTWEIKNWKTMPWK